jgi:hypothetical protein
MRARRLLATAVITVLVAGCDTTPDGLEPPPVPPGSPAPGSRSPATAASLSTGWQITVYYTAVEQFHSGEATTVTGCRKLDCRNGQDDLGSYPAGFVQAVKDEGTGHTAAGPYLNWSYDVGFWLDTDPRDSDGNRLEPFVSAAADPDVLPRGTRLRITDCGRQDDGSAPQEAVCAALRDGHWEITDEFTPGLGGSRHIDAYIGPETGADFTDSDWYITLSGAALALG